MPDDENNIYDLIIVGQGLAGTSIAWHAHFIGKNILIIDNPSRNISSSVAAGIFHPLASRTYGVSWMADEFFPYLHSFYPRVEQLCNSYFFHSKTYFRPFLSEEDKLSHIDKITDHPYLTFVNSDDNSFIHNSIYHNVPSSADTSNRSITEESKAPWFRLGGVEVRDAGYLDIMKYMKSTAVFFSSRDSYISADFEYDKLEYRDNIYHYKGYKSRSIIFCEGVNIINNPFFEDVEVIPNRGEIIHGQIEGSIDSIYSRKVFVLPLDITDNRTNVIVGATYGRLDRNVLVSNSLPLTPTLEGRDYLVKMYERLLPFRLSIDDMKVGIRPTTKDRRPIISRHNRYNNMYLMNGLGSKGVSLSPLLGRKFIEDNLL